MPILTGAEKDQIGINKAQLLGINPSQGRVQVKSNNPVVELIAEAGGSAAAYQVINGDTSHLVMDVSWSPNNEDMLFSLFDKTSGALNAQMELRPDGKLYVGQKLMINETDIDTVMNTLLGKIIVKADKTSLPTVYSGEVEPANTLGKDLDWYHRFELGSSTVVDLYTGTSAENYSPYGFFLRAVSFNDAIEMAPGNRLIFIDSPSSTTLPAEDLTLTIDGSVIPLAIVSNTAGSMVVAYEQTWDAVIENITATTSFKITATEGIQTDKEFDYQKHNGEWHKIDFMDVDEINELIRSYHTIVVMSLADDKKPTRAEAITAFKQLPNYDWAKDDTFYIRDSTGTKTMFCTYFADNATNEANAGPFFFKDMNECV